MPLHTFVILSYGESDDLEECIKSVLKQSVKSHVVMATSTPNNYIIDLASKYGLGIIINESESNKGSDYNFAINYANTKLVTIAHQDDLYDRNYTKEISKVYRKNKDASIIFTDNYEIDKDKIIKNSKDLCRKRRYLYPLSLSFLQKNVFFKMLALKKDKYICTSSITFVKNNLPKDLFPLDFNYYNDWQGLINLAKGNTKFVYVKEKLVGYRIDDVKKCPQKDEKRKRIQDDLKKNNLIFKFKNKG